MSGEETLNYDLPDDRLLNYYEKILGITFPQEYRLVQKTLGNIFYGTLELLSITKDKTIRNSLLHAVADAKELGMLPDWLPICEDNGSYYCITPEGRIRYWTSDGASDESWHDLASWIKDVWIG